MFWRLLLVGVSLPGFGLWGASSAGGAFESWTMSGVPLAERRVFFSEAEYSPVRNPPFSHNFYRFMTVEDLEAHPEWFSEGLRPEDVRDGRAWMPNVVSESLVDHVAELVRERWRREGPEVGFALGLNDRLNFPREMLQVAAGEEPRFFRKRPDLSNVVFRFYNEVAEQLEEEFPEGQFGVLSYMWWEGVPDFPVHRNVLPFLTADRSQWYDREFARRDRELIRAWTQAGPDAVGIYDYYYGRPFAVPRIFYGLQAESIRWAWAQGVRHFYAEAYPVWGFDAAKVAFVAALVQGDERPVEAILQEISAELYGGAAEAMSRFFARCEELWLEQPGEARWIKYYDDEAQAYLFTPEACRELRGYLRLAEKRVKGEFYSANVARASEAFGLTERFVEFGAVRRDLADTQVRSVAELRRAYRLLMEYERARRELRRYQEEDLHDPLNHRLRGLDFMYATDPAPGVLVEAVRFAKSLPEAERYVEPLLYRAERYGDAVLSAVARELRHTVSWQKLDIPNGDFETVRATSRYHEENPYHRKRIIEFPGWSLSLRPAEYLSVKEARDAELGRVLRISGSEQAALSNVFPVDAGRLMSFRMPVRGSVSQASIISLRVRWYDASGKLLSITAPDRLMPGHTKDWKALRLAAIAPEGAAFASPLLFVLYQESTDWLEVGELSVEVGE